MDPLSIIASTIAIVEAITTTYKAIQHLRGLPDEFNKVAQNLPLARDTLGLARGHLQSLDLDEQSKNALQPLISNCEEKAKLLHDIFEKVEKGMKNAKDGSVLDYYRISLLHYGKTLGKAHRVERLMGDILTDLNALSKNRLFTTATQSQVSKLKEAIDELSQVRSSVSDSEFENAGSNIMNNKDNTTGYMSVISGQSHNINPGSGKFFNAQTMTFVQSNEHNTSRSDILQALHTSPYLDRKNRNPDRVPGTCEWFVGHKYFRQWLANESSSILWVSANPGCGKSVLVKYLVDSKLPTTESRTTSYFFFKDDFEDQKTVTNALSCILHQILVQRKDLLSDKIVQRFEDHKTHFMSSVSELWQLLVLISKDENAGEFVCILDAFDECEDQQRDMFVEALRKFYGPTIDKRNDANLKFLITSRPYNKIKLNFQPIIHLEGESEEEISNIAKEVDVYIDFRVSCIRQSLCLEPDEAALLLKGLRRVPNQTYLWVYLTLDLLENDISINRDKICEATSSLPKTVDDAYERILSKSKDATEAKKLLHIIVAAARPLTLAEMDMALALHETHRSYGDVKAMPEVRFRKYVADLCGLFITITNSKIYLLHQTAKEFLVPKSQYETCSLCSMTRKPASTITKNTIFFPSRRHCNPIPTQLRQSEPKVNRDDQLTWKHSLQPSESHRVLYEICNQILLLDQFTTYDVYENRYKEGSRSLRDHILLEYSAMNWATHFRQSDIKDDTVKEPLRQIFYSYSKPCFSWFDIYWARTHESLPRGFTMLMIAAYFGLEQIVKLHLDNGEVNLNSTDYIHGRSALSWASENGYDDVVKLLIEGPKFRFKNINKWSFLKAAKVDAKDKSGRTPLSYAAWNGHTAVVDRLIKAGARADSGFDELGGQWIKRGGFYSLSLFQRT